MVVAHPIARAYHHPHIRCLILGHNGDQDYRIPQLWENRRPISLGPQPPETCISHPPIRASTLWMHSQRGLPIDWTAFVASP